MQLGSIIHSERVLASIAYRSLLNQWHKQDVSNMSDGDHARDGVRTCNSLSKLSAHPAICWLGILIYGETIEAQAHDRNTGFIFVILSPNLVLN